jgi:hypothetical protein
MADHRKLVDDFGLSVATWCNAKKGDRREAAHRESIAAKKALMAELSGLRQLADEYDACIRHMDAGGDFHEFMTARSREFEQAQQGNAGVMGSATDRGEKR